MRKMPGIGKIIRLRYYYLYKIRNRLVTINKRCINIGCGSDIRDNWINCDFQPHSDAVKKFNILDSKDLEWLSNTEANLIESLHVIGYLNYYQALLFFKSVFLGLKVGGSLVLEFPDIKKISLQLVKSKGEDIDQHIEMIRAIYAFDSVDAFDSNFSKQTYVFGWTGDIVSKELKKIGFKIVKIKKPRTHGRTLWRDVRSEAYK